MNRTRILLSTCGLFFISLFQPTAGHAYKRAVQSLTVAIAQADAIVVARTTQVPERPSLERQSAEIEITAVLKGELIKGPFTVHLNEAHSHALGVLKAGELYIFFLRSPEARPTEQEVMFDGTCPHTEADAEKIKSLIALTPPWSAPNDGLSTTIVPDKYHFAPDEELTIYIGCRNVSDHKITLTYSDWPLATHTFWALEITPESGAPIPAKDHPTLTPASINDYFSKFHRTYDITLEPKQEFFYGVQRVNSAKPGWGYKEELDFKFYPMSASGRYDIVARAKNLAGGADVVATGLRVWVK